MNLSAALDQFEDICLTALSNATFLDKMFVMDAERLFSVLVCLAMSKR